MLIVRVHRSEGAFRFWLRTSPPGAGEKWQGLPQDLLIMRPARPATGSFPTVSDAADLTRAWDTAAHLPCLVFSGTD
jgi:hypothetical protein